MKGKDLDVYLKVARLEGEVRAMRLKRLQDELKIDFAGIAITDLKNRVKTLEWNTVGKIWEKCSWGRIGILLGDMVYEYQYPYIDDDSAYDIDKIKDIRLIKSNVVEIIYDDKNKRESSKQFFVDMEQKKLIEIK